jgi:uncharacterized membrane protein
MYSAGDDVLFAMKILKREVDLARAANNQDPVVMPYRERLVPSPTLILQYEEAVPGMLDRIFTVAESRSNGKYKHELGLLRRTIPAA